MRVYSQLDEDKVRSQALVEDWTRSGLLNEEQKERVQPELATSLRRIHSVLRAVLALFTVLLVIASVALTMSLLHVSSAGEKPIYLIWATICIGLAWLLAAQGHIYRCGVEEALAASSVILLVLGVTQNLSYEIRDQAQIVVVSLGAFGLYGAFRFRWALVIAALLAGIAPFTFRMDSVAERILSLSIFAILFLSARVVQRQTPGETTDADWTAVQATAFAGFYLVLNLMIGLRTLGFRGGLGDLSSGRFYWFTYIMAWIVPAAGLWLGIRERGRLLMDVSGLALLATILTNKTYLGWTHQTWDPIVLGVLLIVVAVVLRRRLAREGGAFTPLRLLDSENRLAAAASALALAVPQNPSPTLSENRSFKGGGGQSGGGGAGGTF